MSTDHPQAWIWQQQIREEEFGTNGSGKRDKVFYNAADTAKGITSGIIVVLVIV